MLVDIQTWVNAHQETSAFIMFILFVLFLRVLIKIYEVHKEKKELKELVRQTSFQPANQEMLKETLGRRDGAYKILNRRRVK